jgi:hypothetical protein
MQTIYVELDLVQKPMYVCYAMKFIYIYIYTIFNAQNRFIRSNLLLQHIW